MDKVTIIIPTFNRAKYLAECIDSILSQTLKAYQVIVINDGSSDDTKSVCERYKHSIEYYELNQVGKPGAINYGIKKVTGDYIWIFDDDDVALAEALERFIEPLRNNPKYGFSYSKFYYSSTDSENGRIGAVLEELRIPDVERRGFLIPLLEANFLGGASLFARTSCYREVGYFNEKLLRSQDYEMAIRMARRFKGIRVSGGATFHYRQHEGIRGALVDRFPIEDRQRKWDEYARLFFRQLYKEISLEEYLPPGEDLTKKTRQAMLQRIEVMCTKELLPEIFTDLKELAELKDNSPINKEEYEIIWNMIFPSYHGGRIFDHPEFFKEIGRLASTSPIIRLLRKKVCRSIFSRYRYRNNTDIKQISTFISRLAELYIVNPSETLLAFKKVRSVSNEI
jgi:glycosyltransferase involved in cell wall biosynthesis